MSSDDEDLKRAIALSLEEVEMGVHHNNPIVISSDDEAATVSTSRHEHTSTPIIAAATANTTSGTTKTSTFLSERAQLEAARLARAKRMREPRSGPATASSSSNPKVALEDPFVSSDEESQPLLKKNKLSSTEAQVSSPNVARRKGGKGEDAQSQESTEGLFWNGELRQTANIHVEKARYTKPLFRLHDILGDKSELIFCILSSYVTQLSWIYSLLPSTVPVLLVAQPGEDGAASVHNVLPNWVKVTPHLRGGRGCMHIKLMLLFYKTGRLRVVITTANLMDYDWRDIENSVWLQDVHRRLHPHQRRGKGRLQTDFGAHLEKVLDALNVPEGLKALRVDHPEIPLNVVTDLRRGWDFDKVTAKLVASLAGRHEGWPTVFNVGHTRLMCVVKAIGAFADTSADIRVFANERKKDKGRARGTQEAAKRTLQLECQTSSIGSYTPAWIDEFFISARGASPEEWLDAVKAKRAKEIETMVKHRGWPNIKIIFPSLKTVRQSRLGEDGAGTMFCQRRQWNGSKFPRELFYDSNSRRGPILMHSKMILATLKDAATTSRPHTRPSGTSMTKQPSPSPIPDSSETEISSDELREVNHERDERILGWAYVGSHNFTPSAWGTLSGSSFSPVMNITNYELGIVLPFTRSTQADEIACWDRPPRKYDLKTDEPWIQDG